MLEGRLVQQALVLPTQLSLVEPVGSAAAYARSLSKRHWRPEQRLAWRCCWGPWWPCQGPWAVGVRLLGDDRNCASEGMYCSAAEL